MGSKLYVGNLSYNTSSSELGQLFGQHGTVQSAEVIQDRDTGQSKGFGFVQMGSDGEAQAAITALNGQQQDGRAMTVNEAKPREERPRSGGSARTGGGTGNFGGFRSSCTNNLVVADGILAAPDYTRTCTCSYQNQCSIALVPTADAEEWTFYGKNKLEKVIQRVGVNLGAPGDRRAPDGTLWLEFPSPCSSFTGHFTDANNGATFENIPIFGAYGTVILSNTKADTNGSFSTAVTFFADDCTGTFHIVARGNTSGFTGVLAVTVSGGPTTTNASLVASKSVVNAFNDTITFFASGFGSNETLNCWTTSPDGRAVAYGIPGSFQPGPKMGPDGSGVISLTTGSHIGSPDDPIFQGVDPQMSEGSLGVWALTCRGIASGTYAIANYTVTGGPLDP